MVKKDRLVEKFIQLVEIDSVSRQEREMADRLKEELENLGCEVYEDDAGEKIGGNAGNLIAKLPGDSSLPVVLLSAHMDRVEPGKGVKALLEDGYIMSKGETVLGGDDIIGVVAILETLRIIKQEEQHPSIKVVFSVAEEGGLFGAKNLNQKACKDVYYGIVLDVDGEIGTVVNQAPSQNKFNAVITGEAAHAGMEPENGVNAIKIASHAISEMKLGQVNNETTANIGVIRGGIASNIVPDLVELEGEARSLNYKKLLKQTDEMKNITSKYVKKYGGEVEFDITQTYKNFKINRNSRIIKIVREAAEKLDLPFNLTSSGGGSDANIFNNKGIPTVNLGTGMEKVHSTDERVKIENMLKLTEYLISILNTVKEV
jgi:tripeptide aminopeptidase